MCVSIGKTPHIPINRIKQNSLKLIIDGALNRIMLGWLTDYQTQKGYNSIYFIGLKFGVVEDKTHDHHILALIMLSKGTYCLPQPKNLLCTTSNLTAVQTN